MRYVVAIRTGHVLDPGVELAIVTIGNLQPLVPLPSH